METSYIPKDGVTTREITQAITHIVSYTGGQLPGFTPTLSVAGTTWQFISGRNPYDAFRGRYVLTEDEFSAGGKYAIKPFLLWQFNQMGGGIFAKFYHRETIPTERTAGEKFLSLPLLSNIVGRFIKVSSYGRTEEIRKEKEKIKSEVARTRIELRSTINDYVKKVQEGESFNAAARELIREVLGRYPQNKEELAEAKKLKKQLKVAVIRGEADPYINELIYAWTNDEKIAILKRYKKTMSKEDFAELRSITQKEGIVNPILFHKL